MNSFKMRYYYMAPLLVLAMVACAKRDNNFAKKAGEAKAAQEKAAQEKAAAGKTTTPPGKDGANPGTGADTSVTTNPDGTKKTEENKDQNSTVKNAYKGDPEQTYADSCENKFPMEIDKDNKEEELHLKDIITKEKGSYVIKSTDLFAERTDRNSKVLNQIVFSGSAYDDFKPTTTGQAFVVNCHTINLAKNSTQTMKAGMAMPYEISTVDGAVKAVRIDKVELKNQSTAETFLKAKEDNITDFVEKESEGRKVLLIKHSDSTDITIRIQTSIKDDKTGSVMKRTYSATYSLKK